MRGSFCNGHFTVIIVIIRWTFLPWTFLPYTVQVAIRGLLPANLTFTFIAPLLAELPHPSPIIVALCYGPDCLISAPASFTFFITFYRAPSGFPSSRSQHINICCFTQVTCTALTYQINWKFLYYYLLFYSGSNCTWI